MNDSIFISEWKDRMKSVIKLRYGDELDKTKIDKYLNKIIKEKLKNPNVIIINNYINKKSRTNVLSLIDIIKENNLIIGGGGVLYQQHNLKENPLIDFIIHVMAERKAAKKMRDSFEKNTDEWIMYDIKQLNAKILINSLYGALGYAKFVFHNIFNAEAITNQGRQIICTATECFEAFLSDNVNFSTEGELMEYIYKIHNEYKTLYKNRIDTSIFKIDDLEFNVIKRLVNKCKFNLSDQMVINIENIVKTRSKSELLFLYYKNNLNAFNQNQFIKDKYKFIFDTLPDLKAPEEYLIEDKLVLQTINDIWDFYKTFVIMNYQIFDRTRKVMYIDKKAVLYIDTDSNFIGLHPIIEYYKNEVLNQEYNKSERNLDFICVNIITLYLTRLVDMILQSLCKNMNVTEEYAKYLKMKNEFFFETILFTTVKKRYISNALLQEGKLLKNGLGMSEITGFDFKKATVKTHVKEFYEKICTEDILTVDKINVEGIFKKMILLQADIEKTMKMGDNKYYKQSTVQIISHYKNPFSTQGITAVLLWNALCPDYPLVLPTDVDIIPIKEMTLRKPPVRKDQNTRKIVKVDYFKNKNIEEFANKYPEAYDRLYNEIYTNKNPLIRHMSLKYIAKPKNKNIPLPEWFGDIVDSGKVVSDTISLFNPIMESLGLRLLKTSATKSHLANIVDL